MLLARLARFINRDMVVVGDISLEDIEAVNIFGATTGRRDREVPRDLDNAPESTPAGSFLLAIFGVTLRIFEAFWILEPKCRPLCTW